MVRSNAVMSVLVFNAGQTPSVNQWVDDLNVAVRAIMMETHTIFKRVVILRFVAKMETANRTRRVFFCPKASEIVKAFATIFSVESILSVVGRVTHHIASVDQILSAMLMITSLDVSPSKSLVVMIRAVLIVKPVVECKTGSRIAQMFVLVSDVV